MKKSDSTYTRPWDRKYVTNVVHQFILRRTVNGHTHVMIVKKHTKQDQHYAGTALLIGRRAYRVTEEEELLWKETDHKGEEVEVTTKGEAEVRKRKL